jgi:hypothetical protein
MLIILGFCLGAAQAQSIDTRSTLVGSWENSIEPQYDNVPIITDIIYADDGTYSGTRKTKMREIFRVEAIEGTWTVEETGTFDFTIFRHPYDGGEVESEMLNWEDEDLLTGDEETAFYRRVELKPDDPDASVVPEE